jgi:uncharacterized phiE125 gp8 family phage protein
MSLSTSALVTLADVKTFLGLQNISASDAILEIIIEAVSASVTSEASPDLKSTTYTAEAYDGTGKSYFYLDHYPVTTLTSVVEDDTTLVKDTDYFSDDDEGILEKPVGYKWTTARGGVVVTYVAGYATLPADIKLACLIEVGRAFAMVDHKMFGESSRTVDGTSVTLNTDELLPATLATLGRYTRTRI